MDPNLPILHVQDLDESTGPHETMLRVASTVSASLGVVGLLLATIGVYGVTAHNVARRTREIGIRVVLGAGPADVWRVVLRHGLSLVLIGSGIGLALAVAAGQLLMLSPARVPPPGAAMLAGAAALFALVGLAACWLPLRRAVRVEAIEAIRHE